MRKIITYVITGALLILPGLLYSETGDYLILQDIGRYKLDKPEKMFPGEPPMGGPRLYDSIGGPDSFPDHIDKNYEVMYLGDTGFATPTVTVTQHASGDIDKWLLHELDRDFRNYYGIPGLSFGPRQINKQTIIENLVAGGSYRWISGNIVVNVEYHDSQMTKPEPIEVIQAYLAKYPSTIKSFTLGDLRSIADKSSWIKDEMDRRLWLCDKWFLQLELKKKQKHEVVQEVVKGMTIFVNYREKYFREFGLLKTKADDEKTLLTNLQSEENTISIKNKLEEYKKWWRDNRSSAISF